MLQSNPSYDPVALKRRIVQRYGADLGGLVFDAEVNRRRAQDARAAALTDELAAIDVEISALMSAATARRAKAHAELDTVYAQYLALCASYADADSQDQSAVAPLTARSMQLQQERREILLPRQTEAELEMLAKYSSTDSAFLRALDKKLPPLNTPAPSALEKINMGGLHNPRS
jgi:hypothetical protein